VKNIIILDGTSGIWKNSLLEYTTRHLSDSTVVEKISNRAKRLSDKKNDLTLTMDSDLSKYNLEYTYFFAGKQYGVSKSNIEEALRRYDNVFITIRSQNVISRLKTDFSEHNIFSVFIYSDMDCITEFLSLYNDDILRDSILQAYTDYSRNPDIYDLVVINGKQPNDFFRLINYIVEKAKAKPKFNANSIPKKNRGLFLNMIFPLIYSVLLGIAVNIISGNDYTTWSVTTIILSIALTVLLVFIHVISLKKE